MLGHLIVGVLMVKLNMEDKLGNPRDPDSELANICKQNYELAGQ